jgi:hypothetical protein
MVGQADEHELARAGGLPATICRDRGQVECPGDRLHTHRAPAASRSERQASAPGLGSVLGSFPRPGPFTTSHARHISVGRERWRPAVNACQQCWKACWCRIAMRETRCAADKDVCCDRADCARYAPGQDICQHVSAGQGRTQQPSPEPLLLQGKTTRADCALVHAWCAGAKAGADAAGKRFTSSRLLHRGRTAAAVRRRCTRSAISYWRHAAGQPPGRRVGVARRSFPYVNGLGDHKYPLPSRLSMRCRRETANALRSHSAAGVGAGEWAADEYREGA